MNKEKIAKMDDEVKKWSRKDPMAIKKAMYYPATLEALERGEMVKDYNSNSTNLDSEDDEDPRTPASVSSQVRHPRTPESIISSQFRNPAVKAMYPTRSGLAPQPMYPPRLGTFEP